MNRDLRHDGLSAWAKWAVLSVVAVAPLVFGAGSPGVYLPLYALVSLMSAASWTRARFDRSLGRTAPTVPGRRLLLALLALVLLQLVPLPPALLAVVSPGSWAFHHLGQPHQGWQPISVSRAATARGFLSLAGAMALYAFAFREYRSALWRRRAIATLAVAAAALGLAGLVQAASDDPRRLYGMIDVHIERGWGVWGPYLNRNHFAGYVAMAVPLGLGLAIAGSAEVRQLHRRFGLGRALGAPSFPAALQWSAFALFLLVAALAPQSRGALLGLAAGLGALLALAGHSRVTLLAGGVLGVLVLATLDLSSLTGGFEVRGFNRSGIWRAALLMLPDFPVFGAGLNTFLVAFQPYQIDFRGVLVTAAHNDFLQVATDLGLVGIGLVAGLGYRVLRAMLGARGDILAVAAGAGVASAAGHALVDYSLQTPANATAFAVLCGILMAGAERADVP